jgi:hypothetical protein
MARMERKEVLQRFGGETFLVRPLRRPKHKEEDNIKINLKIWKGVDWINLAEGRDNWYGYTNTAINVVLDKLRSIS